MKWLKSDKGFSLVEVMVGAAMAGGLALVITQLSQNASKSKNHFESSMEITSHFASISAAMQNTANCSVNFEGQSTTASVTYPQLNRCLNIDPATQKCMTGAANRAPLVTINQTNDNNTFRVTQIETVPQSGNVLNLSLTYERVKGKSRNNSVGADTIKKSVALQTIQSGGVIDSCYSDMSNAIETAVIQACQGPNARLEGTSGSSSDPIRCVHDTENLVNFTDITAKTSLCSTGQFFNGYTLGADNKLTPECVNISAKTVCADGQYLLQVGANLVCRTVPTCDPGQHLTRSATDGSLICGSMNTCGSGAYAVFNGGTGSITCVSCGPGQLLVNTDSGWQCRSPNCLNTKNSSQQYFVGFDSTGAPICNNLVEESSCTDAGRLKVTANGSVTYECCTPECSGATAPSNICVGQSAPANNGCGQCKGEKALTTGCDALMPYCANNPPTSECGVACSGGNPSTAAVLHPNTGTWSSCTASSTTQSRTLDCTEATCGGTPTCSSYNRIETRDCMLTGGTHTFAQCRSAGGTVLVGLAVPGGGSPVDICLFATSVPVTRNASATESCTPYNVGAPPTPNCPASWNKIVVNSNYFATATSGTCCARNSDASGCGSTSMAFTPTAPYRYRQWMTGPPSTIGKDARRAGCGFTSCCTTQYDFSCFSGASEVGCI
jgi:hypothetical protein